MANRDQRALLNELKIERAGRSVGVAVRRVGTGVRKGLFLAAAVLLIGSGAVAMNWGAIMEVASGASPEPLQQKGRSPGLQAPARPQPAFVSARPAELAATPAAGHSGASVSQDSVIALEATGHVVARRQATIGARITGRLAKVFVEEGDHVQSGQVIALLDDSAAKADLALADSRLLAAKSRLRELQLAIDHADKRLARSVELAGRHLVSEARVDDDRLAKEALLARLQNLEFEIDVAQRERDVGEVRLADTRVQAPFTGVVIDQSAHPGEIVSPMCSGGAHIGIGTIVDMDSLEVEVDINEAYLNRVFPNQTASVRLNAYSNRGYEARVVAIVPGGGSQQGDRALAHRPLGEGRADPAEHGRSGGIGQWRRRGSIDAGNQRDTRIER
ncbi:MAG: efflux RND transporter periplasmic adaptor subunit [Gammaproteobacteria bacterium]|nr:efflux RND transporter periplasmic adaptor subunit [Gammaproteobacteria bacterium]